MIANLNDHTSNHIMYQCVLRRHNYLIFDLPIEVSVSVWILKVSSSKVISSMVASY